MKYLEYKAMAALYRVASLFLILVKPITDRGKR